MAFLTGFLAWMQGSVVTTLSVLAIIGVGATMLAMRFHPLGIIAAMAGVWVMFNAENLAAMLHQ